MNYFIFVVINGYIFVGRDLLLVSGVFEDNIWVHYLQHLLSVPSAAVTLTQDSIALRRILLQTFSALVSHSLMDKRNSLFSRLCFGRIGGQVITVLSSICGETLDRIQQALLIPKTENN